MKKLYIGVDQSLSHTGIVVFENEKLRNAYSIITSNDFFKFYTKEDFKSSKAYKAGLINDDMKLTKKKTKLTKQEKKLLNVEPIHRINTIADTFDFLLKRYLDFYKKENIFVCLESISFGSKGMIIDLGKLLGTLERTCYLNEIRWMTVTPQEVKKFATGSGTASKDEMIAAITNEEHLKMLIEACPKNKKGEPDGLDNLADAYHIARFGRENGT